LDVGDIAGSVLVNGSQILDRVGAPATESESDVPNNVVEGRPVSTKQHPPVLGLRRRRDGGQTRDQVARHLGSGLLNFRPATPDVMHTNSGSIIVRRVSGLRSLENKIWPWASLPIYCLQYSRRNKPIDFNKSCVQRPDGLWRGSLEGVHP
jgi:hypothetical protein